MINYFLIIKKHSQHHFYIGPNFLCFFWSGWYCWDPLRRLGYCFIVIAITQVSSPMTMLFSSFHQHLHSWQAVYLHQRDFVSDLHSAAMAPIWIHSDAKCSENLISCGFWNSFCLCYFMNSQTTIGTNHFPNFLDVFFIFWCWRLSWTFIVLSWSLALFKMFVPLHGFVFHSWLCVPLMALSPNTCFNISKVSKTFSLIWNKISHEHLAYENRPFLITEKYAQQARRVHSNRQSTTTKQTRMIWIVAFALGSSLTPQRNQRDLAPTLRWHTNSKVWILYGVTSFFSNL